MIGLLVGFKQQQQNDALRQGDKSYAAQGPAWHDTDPEDGRRNMVWADGSMNLTWVSSRVSIVADGLISPFLNTMN